MPTRRRREGARPSRPPRARARSTVYPIGLDPAAGTGNIAPVTLLLVGLAGLVGVLARYGISSAFHGAALPWATVGINVAGSFLLGVLVVAHATSDEFRTVIGVGFLGGFTTFSTFSVQALLDLEAGEPFTAFTYVLASVGLGLAAAAAGYYLGRAAF